MSETSRRINEGHYARKQIHSRDRLIAWSHRSRFRVGLSLARAFAGKRVLDLGCGDGTFVAMLMSGEAPPARAVGAEIAQSLVDDCRNRLGHVAGLEFVLTSDLSSTAHARAYDAVVCMEVLEHVVDVPALLDVVHHVLVPGGALLVSVPVETGLPLLVKQMARRLAGWRGIGDYPGTDPYSVRELVAGVLAGAQPHMARRVHRGSDGSVFHDHKGFNWMALRRVLERTFVVERTLSSPLPALPPHLASQAWFVCRRRT